MYRIIGARGIGKTYKLLEEANRLGGIVICNNPMAMRQKARSLGFENISDFMDFRDTTQYYFDKPIFIDNIEDYVKAMAGRSLAGYTYTIDEDESR